MRKLFLLVLIFSFVAAMENGNAKEVTRALADQAQLEQLQKQVDELAEKVKEFDREALQVLQALFDESKEEREQFRKYL